MKTKFILSMALMMGAMTHQHVVRVVGRAEGL